MTPKAVYRDDEFRRLTLMPGTPWRVEAVLTLSPETSRPIKPRYVLTTGLCPGAHRIERRETQLTRA